MKKDRKPVYFVIAAGLLALPLAVRDPFILHILILANIYAIFVLGWDLMAGFSGQISGGHALSFGAAAYVSAGLSLSGLTPLVFFPMSVIITAFFGVLVGLICCRQTGAYLILITLALAEIAHEFSLSLGFKNAQGYMLGGEGGVPVETLFKKGAAAYYLSNYYLTLLLLFICVAAVIWLCRSALGLKLRAIGCDSLAAQSVGLSPYLYRTAAFGLSFIPGGLAGALYGQYMGVAAPSTLSLELSFAAMVMTVLGGKGTLIGPAAAAYLLTFVFSWFWAPPAVRMIIYSLILILATRRAPFQLLRFLSRPAGRGVK